MKRFRSRFESVARLARQRQQQAEFAVLQSRRIAAQLDEQCDRVLDAQSRAVAALTASLVQPQQVESLLAGRAGLQLQQEHLLALDEQRQQAHEALRAATIEWQLRTTDHDQATQLIDHERRGYRLDCLRDEQLELEQDARQAGSNRTAEGNSP